jgi:hypothetical protein
LNARLTTLLWEEIVTKSKEIKTGSNLEESCKEDYVKKRIMIMCDDDGEVNKLNSHSLRLYFAQFLVVVDATIAVVSS